jgi:ketosteroid isomerase-like protein
LAPSQARRRTYRAFLTGDLPAPLDCFAPDIDSKWPNQKEIAHSGHRRGRDEVARCFELPGGEEEPLDFQQHEFFAQGNRVVVLGSYTGRAKATQRTFTTDYMHAWTIRDGKLSKYQTLYDTAAAVNAYQS